LGWGWLGAIGLATTPVGWVIAAGVVTGGAWFGVTRFLKSSTEERVTVIPEFINTPLDVLALGLFDLMAPLAMKVAAIDGEIHESERAAITRYFIKKWGYNSDFIEEAMAYTERHVDTHTVGGLANLLAEFKKKSPDCNYQKMTQATLDFLQEIVEADGVIDEREEMAIDRIRAIFEEAGQFSVKKTLSGVGGWIRSKIKTGILPTK
jgi:uncharacterized tellurite resistance protein B-like protein